MIRVVLDVNVLVSAFIARAGPPGAVVRAWAAGAFELVVSPRLIAELTAVLARPRFAAQAAGGRAQAYVSAIASGSIRFQDPQDPERISADPDDDYLLALAVVGDADLIVSGDRHLLDLESPPVPVEPVGAFARRLGLDG